MTQREHSFISLQELVPGYAGIPDVPVSGVALDSRKVKTGDAFMALRGSVVDGREYIDAAIEAGAAVVLADGDKLECKTHRDILVVTVPGLAKRVGKSPRAFTAIPVEKCTWWASPAPMVKPHVPISLRSCWLGTSAVPP